ncbi:MAG: hypothetical protein LBR15_08910 [Methanobrevibacter sp.]|jgi:hypothetical protein|nr:hypothetical protein [Candidatus Methanovirga australis]
MPKNMKSNDPLNKNHNHEHKDKDNNVNDSNDNENMGGVKSLKYVTTNILRDEIFKVVFRKKNLEKTIRTTN